MGLLLGIFSLTTFAPPATAIEINVRSHSDLKVGVSSAGTLVRVSGALQDSRGRGMPQRAVQLNFFDAAASALPPAAASVYPTHTERVYTDRNGLFQYHRELSAGRWRVEARFEETPHLSGAQFERALDVRRVPVDLRAQVPSVVLAPARADVSQPASQPIPVRIQALAEGVGLPETARVVLDGAAVGTTTLDSFGRATFLLDAAIAPGLHDVRVELAAARYADTTPAEARLRVSESINVDARMHEVVERLRRGLAVSGNVRDQLGDLPDAQIAVRITLANPVKKESTENARLQHVVQSDARGDFSAFFPSADFGEGTWVAEVEVMTQVGPTVRAEVAPLRIDHRVSRWLLNGLAILGFLGGLGLLVQRFWQVIQTYWVERKRKQRSRERVEAAMDDVEVLVPTVLEEPVDEAVSPAAQRVQIAGLLWDVWKNRPVEVAEIEVRKPDGEVALTLPVSTPSQPSRAGRFQTPELAHGRYTLRVRAPGFMPATMEFRLPHRGQLSRIRLDMVAIPLRIRRLYQSLVEELEGEDLWGVLSPRQIEEALQTALSSEESSDDTGAPSHAKPGARAAFIAALRSRLSSAHATTSAHAATSAHATTSDDPASSVRDADAAQAIGAADLLTLMTDVVEETYFSGRTFDESVWQLARDIAEQLRQQVARQQAARQRADRRSR